MESNGSARILVIDDNAGLRTSLATALESAGYSVRTGADGQQGVEIAREFKPEVVVCDMHMPNANGSSVLAALRKEENFALSQFILMTGDLSGTPQRVGMDLGADDYLAKPFTVDEFLNCVSVRLQRSQLYKKAEDRALLHFRETITHSLPHEVFTPLTGILGFTEVLRDEIGHVSAAEVSKMVNEIHVSAERLYRTLRNYLRILDVLNEKKPVEAVSERTKAADVQGIVLTNAEAVAIRHGRQDSLSLDCAELDIPLSPGDLATVVTELVDNACKYSVTGTPVTIKLANLPAGTQLEINDRGRGMSPDQIAHIGAFRQFDRKKYEQQGLGLGLTLTQHLVELHGGHFQIKSIEGKGTTVTASWPRQSAR
ncbi:MAG TPA: ATP-binding protein [Lacunisphaera sp.]|jgi:signal transduction histidine kinase